ncbi:MAG: sigma-70 family RNA polymerase sigma factor [Planctomycetota bacterium]
MSLASEPAEPAPPPADDDGPADDDLMIALQAGDADAFPVLIGRYQSRLIGFFTHNIKDRTLAEDLTQETFLKLHKAAWDYLPTGHFRAWLFRIARNLLIDTTRKQSRDLLLHATKAKPAGEDAFDPLTAVSGDTPAPGLRADQREVRDIVDDLLAGLPDEQRLTFTLHHDGGMSLPEVAEELGTSLPTTKSRLRLAREKLRAALRPLGLDPHDEGKNARAEG